MTDRLTRALRDAKRDTIELYKPIHVVYAEKREPFETMSDAERRAFSPRPPGKAPGYLEEMEG